MRVGITGSEGFIGWHLRCFLATRDGCEVDGATRETFASASLLRDFVAHADAIVHLAGVNRAPEANDLYEGNLRPARELTDACEAADATPHVIFASSTHVERSSLSAYGRAKIACTKHFEAWAKRCGASFTTLVIPHVFGEHGRPFYNSAVATFCDQLARGETPRVDNDARLELIHAQDLAERILAAAESERAGTLRLHGDPITVSGVLRRLRKMKGLYDEGALPDLGNGLAARLFSTLRSYYFPEAYPVEVSLRREGAGRQFDAVQAGSGGRCRVSRTRPGETRGGHFHRRKLERLLVIQGRARLRLRRLFKGEVHEFVLGGDRPAWVDLPTLHVHDIANVGDGDLVTISWSDDTGASEMHDTHPEQV